MERSFQERSRNVAAAVIVSAGSVAMNACASETAVAKCGPVSFIENDHNGIDLRIELTDSSVTHKIIAEDGEPVKSPDTEFKNDEVTFGYNDLSAGNYTIETRVGENDTTCNVMFTVE
jgi:hypothetical protein